MDKIYSLSFDNKKINKSYQNLLNKIYQCYIEDQTHVILSVNQSIINTNWNIEKYIVEYEQDGKQKAQYSVKLLENLSKDLTLRHGKGFVQLNLSYMRFFYFFFLICETLSHIWNILYDYFDIYNLKSIFFMYDNGSQQCQ